MAEYIEREELLDAIVTSERPPMSAFQIGVAVARKIVKHFPAADVAPVVHGRWIDEGTRAEDGNGQYTCSNCDHHDNHSPGIDVLFCWHCGARMDGE